MAWEFTDVNGDFHSVQSSDLQSLVDSGFIVENTILKSTRMGKSARAKEVAGLKFQFVDHTSREISNHWVDAPQKPSFEYKPRKSAPPLRVGLLDLNFRGAITPTFVSLLWASWLVVGFSSIALISFGLSVRVRSMGASWAQTGAIVFSILVGYVFLTMVVRIVLECTVVLFRIADYLKRMVK